MFSQSCGIDLGDRYVVIGGKDEAAGRKVTLYKDTGFYRSRPDLLVGRHGHSCSKFQDGNGETVGKSTLVSDHWSRFYHILLVTPLMPYRTSSRHP